MLWVDKHRPLTLEKVDYAKEQAAQLARLAQSGDMPHLLFSGPSGAGKKTRVMALLRAMFGSGVEKVRWLFPRVCGGQPLRRARPPLFPRPALPSPPRRAAHHPPLPRARQVKLEHRSFSTPSGKSIDITTVGSNYHIEVNPGDAGMYDRYVVQELIKEMAAYSPLTAAEGKNFKVVLLSEVDRLTKEAQAALRRTMEKYSASCRLILVRLGPGRRRRRRRRPAPRRAARAPLRPSLTLLRAHTFSPPLPTRAPPADCHLALQGH